MSLKILLTADLHIGKGYTSYSDDPKVQDDLVQRRYDVLEDLVETANEYQCDLLVIAGDLFDNPRFRKRKDVEKIEPCLEKFEGRLILVLPGNHDYFSESNKNLWERVDEIEKVIVMDDTRPYDLSKHLESGQETIVYPAPCDGKISKENKIGWIRDIEKDDSIRYHLGIAHGHLEGCSYDQEGKYFPMTEEEIESCGLDLWLLGHVHVIYPDDEESYKNYFYPGTPEQDGFKRLAEESEKGNVWILEVDDDKTLNKSMVNVGKYVFEHEQRNINDMGDFEELQNHIENDEFSETLLKLKIEGSVDKQVYKEIHGYLIGLRDDPKGFKYIKVDSEDFKPKINMKLVKDDFPEGSFTYNLLESVLEDEDMGEKAAQLAYEVIEEVKR